MKQIFNFRTTLLNLQRIKIVFSPTLLTSFENNSFNFPGNFPGNFPVICNASSIMPDNGFKIIRLLILT
ncbi:MAG: hypothetical protein NT175_14155 [Bacteroidetes bacterium]|nr:hypothetical protein [Bacteroidota bacterium]